MEGLKIPDGTKFITNVGNLILFFGKKIGEHLLTIKVPLNQVTKITQLLNEELKIDTKKQKKFFEVNPSSLDKFKRHCKKNKWNIESFEKTKVKSKFDKFGNRKWLYTFKEKIGGKNG